MKSNLTATYLDAACDQVVAGKQAARTIAELVCSIRLKEPEFRLLWCLHRATADLDQRQLAMQLGLSAAQVCALVEKLDQRGFLIRNQAPDDRRRSLWQVSPSGKRLLAEFQQSVEHLAQYASDITPRRISA